jgi:hypothetical protein
MFLDAEEKGKLLFATWASIVVAGHLISLLSLKMFPSCDPYQASDNRWVRRRINFTTTLRKTVNRELAVMVT